jgi:hypothetical protein
VYIHWIKILNIMVSRIKIYVNGTKFETHKSTLLKFHFFNKDLEKCYNINKSDKIFSIILNSMRGVLYPVSIIYSDDIYNDLIFYGCDIKCVICTHNNIITNLFDYMLINNLLCEKCKKSKIFCKQKKLCNYGDIFCSVL